MNLNRLLGFSLLLLSVSAGAVTTQSAPCDQPSASLQGSGWLFQNQGKVYALASSARFLDDAGSGPGSFCHQVDGEPAQLLARESGNGLALLLLPHRKPTPQDPALSDLGGVALSGGETVTVVSAASSVLIASTSRHSLPLVTQAFELQGGEVDGTAVGAPVLLDGKRFAGVLSPEYLKMIPGSPTRPREWDAEPGHVESHLVAISAVDAQQWLQRYFSDPTHFMTYFHEDARGLESGPLRFQAKCPKVGDHGPGDAPIGGGDGVGIGGHEPHSPYCSSPMERETAPASVWPYPAREGWVKSMGAALADGLRLELRFFIHRDPKDGTLLRSPFWSLSDLATRFKDSDLIPVVFRQRKAGEMIADARQKLIAEKAAEALPLAVKLYGSLGEGELHYLMSQLYLLLEVATSEQWATVQAGDLDPLIDLKGRWAGLWEQMLMFSPEDSRPFLADLQAIRKAIAGKR